jgi:hypothetical protein
MVPGPRRDAGAHLPPSCTGTEATLLFPVLLAEARRWGLPEQETRELLPVGRALPGLAANRRGRRHVSARPASRAAPPAARHRRMPTGRRCSAPICSTRSTDPAARNCGSGPRSYAPPSARTSGSGTGAAAGRQQPGHLTDASCRTSARPPLHLLDTGLLGGGEYAPGLLDKVRAEQLARLLGGPAMDSGWGLRGLSVKESPDTARSVTVAEPCGSTETAIAVAGLAAADVREGGELAAARRPRRGRGVRAPAPRDVRGGAAHGRERSPSAPGGLPPGGHGGGCRSAAADHPRGHPPRRPRPHGHPPPGAQRAPGRDRPDRAPRIAGAPFSVRVSRLGVAMVEEAADGLQLGA